MLAAPRGPILAEYARRVFLAADVARCCDLRVAQATDGPKLAGSARVLWDPWRRCKTQCTLPKRLAISTRRNVRCKSDWRSRTCHFAATMPYGHRQNLPSPG